MGSKIKQEESQELVTTDEKLEQALAPLSRQYSEISITKEMFRKFMVPGATDAEVFFCMGKTRALELDPLKPGEVYYIKFQGKPYDLFVGFPVYVAQCYDAGLETWEYEFDNDDNPQTCAVTFYIKGREKPFKMTVWFEEVAGIAQGGKLNARWQKAGRYQFMKCAFVQTARWSGLLGRNLPYILEEMPEPPAEGHRTLTQPQLDAYAPPEGEDEAQAATLGPVSASHHQLDLASFRRKYFGMLNGLYALGLPVMDDEQRRVWQKEELEIEASTSEWDMEIYAEVFEKMAALKIRMAMGKVESENPEVLDEDGQPLDDGMLAAEDAKQEAEAQEAFAKEQKYHHGEPDWEKVKAEAEKQLRADQMFAEAEATGEITDDFIPVEETEELKALKAQYDEVSRNALDTHDALVEWEKMAAGVPVSKWDAAKFRAGIAGMEALKEAQRVVKGVEDREALMNLYQDSAKDFFESGDAQGAFQHQMTGHRSFQDFGAHNLRVIYPIVMSLRAVTVASGPVANEVGEDFRIEDSDTEADDGEATFLITDETVKQIGEALLEFPETKYKTVRSRAFKTFAFVAIGHEYTEFRKILDTDGKLILDALNKELEQPASAPYINDASVKTTDLQMEEIKALIQDMPEHYHGSIGSGAFLHLVTKVLGRPHRGGFGTVSGLEAAKIIEEMKRIIAKENERDEAGQ